MTSGALRDRPFDSRAGLVRVAWPVLREWRIDGQNLGFGGDAKGTTASAVGGDDAGHGGAVTALVALTFAVAAGEDVGAA